MFELGIRNEKLEIDEAGHGWRLDRKGNWLGWGHCGERLDFELTGYPLKNAGAK